MQDRPLPFNMYLKPKKGRVRRHEFVGFDVENLNTTGEFTCMSIVHENGDVLFWTDSLEEARIELLRPKWRGMTFIATNLTFDYSAIFYNTSTWNTDMQKFRHGDIMFVSRDLGKKRGRVLYLDTLNYVPYGVKTLGDIINIPKLEAPEYLGERHPQTREEWQHMKHYNIRDSHISAAFMRFLEDSVNELGGQLQVSAASTSLDLYRRKYMTGYMVKEQQRIRNGEWVEEFIRSAYYGGRVEAFRRGPVEDINYYDINSLYPAVMRERLPDPSSAKHIREPSKTMIDCYEGVSNVTITCPQHLHKPLLPYRDEARARLIFPTGTWTASYNHLELREAVKLGYVINEVHKQIIYTQTNTPFKEFVTDLYARRKELKARGDPMQLAVKLMLNANYGKWAMGPQTDTRIICKDHMQEKDWDYIHTCEYDSMDELDECIVVRSTKQPTSNFIFPILSSYITTHARLLLYRYLANYDVYYCDTDSIMTPDTLPDSKALGEMKLEKHIDAGVLCRSKFYMIDDEVKAKGINRATPKEFEMIMNGLRVEQSRFIKPRTAARSGLLPNTLHTFTKKVDLEDDKRQWTNPFTLQQLQHSIPLKVTP